MNLHQKVFSQAMCVPNSYRGPSLKNEFSMFHYWSFDCSYLPISDKNSRLLLLREINLPGPRRSESHPSERRDFEESAFCQFLFKEGNKVPTRELGVKNENNILIKTPRFNFWDWPSTSGKKWWAKTTSLLRWLAGNLPTTLLKVHRSHVEISESY